MSARRGRPTRLCLALVLLAASACPSDPKPPEPSPVGPPPTGTIRFGYPWEPPTLDPVARAGGSRPTRDILRPVLPSLFRMDAAMRPAPDLAEAWPAPRDFKTDPFSVALRLRKASWSDGKPITAEDVRFTWERLKAGPGAGRYRLLKDVQVQGPRRLTLHFHRPVRRWWALFSIDDPILPAHAYSPAWENGPTVSGGPFAFEGWTRGLSIRLRRNPGYWGKSAGVEAIDVTFVRDEEARLQLLSKGELDAAYAPGEPNFGARSGARGFAPTDGPLTGGPGASGPWGSTWWELDFSPARLKGREVLAEAAGHVADRALVAELLEDTGQQANGIPHQFPVLGPRAEGRPAIDGPWKPGGVDAARKALQGAGFKKSGDKFTKGGTAATFELAYANGSSAAASLARFIHFRMREVGVHVELIGVEPLRYEREWLPEGRADAMLVLRSGADAADASVYAAPPIQVPDLTPILDAAESAADVRKLRGGPQPGLPKAEWLKVQERLAASRLVVPLARVRAWTVSRGGISGPHSTGSAAGPLWNAADWRTTGS